jgi:hypothetical protein
MCARMDTMAYTVPNGSVARKWLIRKMETSIPGLTKLLDVSWVIIVRSLVHVYVEPGSRTVVIQYATRRSQEGGVHED